MKNPDKKDGLLILSGGMDSVTLLHEYKEELALAVSFDYGSKHNEREIYYARKQCALTGTEHLVLKLPFIGDYFKSALLLGGEEIPEGSYADANMQSTVVPFRNGIMLSVAAGLAESRGLGKVYMANHAGDHAVYPDCRPEFVKAMDKAIAAGTYAGLRLVSPYTRLTKADIARHGKALGIDYAQTWSCYKGGHIHCGRCATCLERREALAAAGIQDLTEYES
ncbi:MAG: 7-cyano-7-deazaguanine synthase QueC [Tannerella sp.]|jgi:7-cyano-7-deazaguanine synthase|nr:7-cyano-7-deazaguanine synthase QueC [Tannerella sp.]